MWKLDKSHLILFMALFVLTTTASALERKKADFSEDEGYFATVGLEYESGDYGTSDTTDLWTIPFGIQYQKGALTAGISSSYLDAESTGSIIISDKHMSKITGASLRSASGLGDIDIFATYRFAKKEGSDMRYHATVRYKLGTADEDKGLGTGENDYALEGGLLTGYEKMFVMAILGYQVNGDSATVNYDDVWYLDLGVFYPMTKERGVGALLELSQSATPGFDSPAQLSLFLNQELDKQRDLHVYLKLGLSDGSPDSGVGANITFKL